MATERKVRAWATWLVCEGRAHGLRVPSAEERSRSVGLGIYFTSLALHGRRLYDAIGFRADRRSLQQRVFTAILAWSRDEPPPGEQHPAPTARHLVDAWRAASSFATAHCPWARVRGAPLPADVLGPLQAQGQFPPGPPFP